MSFELHNLETEITSIKTKISNLTEELVNAKSELREYKNAVRQLGKSLVANKSKKTPKAEKQNQVEMVLSYISEAVADGRSCKEIQENLNLSPNRTTYLLTSLKEEGKISITGNRRSARYVCNSTS